jgi:hypothetical protein
MPWQSNGRVIKDPQLQPGYGSVHTNGKCVEKVLAELKIPWLDNCTAAYLLFIDKSDNIPLHIDPSALSTVRGIVQKKPPRPHEFLTKLEDIRVQCFDAREGNLLGWLGDRLHGVHNVLPSFSFGLHYKSTRYDGEWVVYGVLSGHKQIVLVDCRDREMDVFINSLNVSVTMHMCSENTARAAIISSVRAAAMRNE